jgi:hypothetical protein
MATINKALLSTTKEPSAIALSSGSAYAFDETQTETQMYWLTGPLFFASSDIKYFSSSGGK